MKSQKLNINSQKYLFVTMLILAVVLMPLRLVEAEVTITAVELNSGNSTPTILLEKTFTLQLQIDTGGIEVVGLEVYLTFDPNDLEVQGEKPFTVGEFFEGGTEILNQQDGPRLNYKIKISPAKQGSGTIASLTFKAISLSSDSSIKIDFDLDKERETQVTGMGIQSLPPVVPDPLAEITIQRTIIKVDHPNGGEILKTGSLYNIIWRSESIGEEIDHVKISYSTDGGGTYPNLIMENAPHDPENPINAYVWTIPDDIESDQVKIKIIAYDSENKKLAEDESDDTFEISPEAAVTIEIHDSKGLSGDAITVSIELQNPEHLLIFSVELTFEYTSDTPGLLTNPVANTSGTITDGWLLAQNPLENGNGVWISLTSSTPMTDSGTLVGVLLDVKSGTSGGETATLSLSQAKLNDGAISVEIVPTVPEENFRVPYLGVTAKKITLRVGETHKFNVIDGREPYIWQVSDDSFGEIDDNGEFTALGGWMENYDTYFLKGTVTVTDDTGRDAAEAEVTVTLRYGDVSRFEEGIPEDSVLGGDGEVNEYDAVVVLKSTVKLVELSDCQDKAADVDGNLNVSAYDASLILRYWIDIISIFPVEIPLAPPPQPSVQAGEIWLGAYQERFESTFTVPVLIKELDGLLSGKLVLSYNPQEIAFVEVEPTLLTKNYLFAHKAASGQLTLTFAGATQLDQDGVLLHLNFKKISSDSQRGIDSIVLSEAKLNDGNLRAVLQKVRQLPSRSELLANFPNPFNPETWIPYQLAEAGRVTIKIYTLTGQLVRQFSLGHKEEGYYLTREQALHWDGTNQLGESVGSGVYFYSIETPQFSATKKMLLLK